MSSPKTNVKRSSTATSSSLSLHSGARIVRWARPSPDATVHEIESINPRYKAGLPLSENYIIPPYHWHWHQDEIFRVTQGTFLFKLEGVETRKTAADGEIRIPARAHHTFRADPECEAERCVVEFTTGKSDVGGEGGVDEKFFRNIYSYLHDCDEQNVQPSLPQMLLFLDSAEVGLALPIRPRFLANWVSWAMGVVIGRWFGRWMLGLRASYGEYWDDKLGKGQ